MCASFGCSGSGIVHIKLRSEGFFELILASLSAFAGTNNGLGQAEDFPKRKPVQGLSGFAQRHLENEGSLELYQVILSKQKEIILKRIFKPNSNFAMESK